jgi:penicillin-binding protein 1A
MSLKKFWHEARKNFPLTTMQKVFFAALIVIGFLTGIFIAQIIVTFSDLKDIKTLENYSTYAVPTKVYDINSKLITEFFLEKREIVSYKELPESLIKAIISIEDNDFYKHHGFNFLAFMRGVILDPIMGKRARGASTLTQQLAKGLFTSGERSVFRKLIELWYAFQIEKKYSKEEILELYFNQVYFGHGCYGVQAAANYFFNKNAKDLTLGESSLLAGLVQLPTSYSPIFSPYKAQKRHATVLYAMAKLGYITQDEATETFESFWDNYASTIKAKGISIQRSENNPAPFFTEYVRMQLIEQYGEEKLYSGGLQIFTTLDVEKQKYANQEMISGLSNEQINYDAETRVYSARYKAEYEDIIDLLSLTFGIDNIKIGPAKVMNRLEEMVKKYDDMLYLTSFTLGLDSINRKIKSRYILSSLIRKKMDRIEGALVSVNPKTGYIEAMVGGSEFSYANQYNRAVLMKRQMGSMFKPVYYAIALDKKLITPATVYEDKPMIYQDVAGNLWAPRNYEGTFRGKLRIRQALQYSVNLVSIQVWDMMLRTIGYNTIVSLMSDYFGMGKEDGKKRVQPQLAYALGVGTFSPLEIAHAFGIFANNGIAIKPISILKVKDRYGRTLQDLEMVRDMDKSTRQTVMDPGSAYLMQSMMYDVLYHGTGASAAVETEFHLTAGGKTGTTPNWKDAWFAGFTKNLVTVVWFGFDDANRSLGRHRSAAVVAAPVWMRYMKQALKDTPDVPFTPADNVVEVSVCATTGYLPTEFCPHVIPEYFLRNTGPSKRCDVHTSLESAKEEEKLQMELLTNNLQFDEYNMDISPDSQSNAAPKSGLDDGESFKVKPGIQ